MRELIEPHWQAINGRYAALSQPHGTVALALGIGHVVALLAVSRLARWPWWLAPGLVVLLTLPGLIRWRRFEATLLTPLGLLYALAGLRVLLALVFRLRGLDGLPPAWGQALSFEWGLGLSLVWLALLQLGWVLPAAWRTRALAVGLALAGLAWALTLYPRLIPAGVTGADPYAYVQMAVDLMTRGRLTHPFPLAQLAFDLDLPVYPFLHVGYNADLTPALEAATVWPPGFSVLLAGVGSLLGVDALLAVNAVLALLALALTGVWGRTLASDSVETPWLLGLVAAGLLLTSMEQTVRLATPLADVAAQLATTVALLAALHADAQDGDGGDDWRWAALAGLLLGVAYTMRYTQVLMMPGFLWLWWRRPRSLVAFLAAAALVALPDLAYHHRVYGNPFETGSSELIHFAVGNLLPVSLRVGSDALRDGGWLALPALVGAWRLAQDRRRAVVFLALALGGVTLFHLFYWYLKLRDLLWWWPTLAVLAALGLWQLRRWPGVVLALLLVTVGLRVRAQMPLLDGFYTFGTLNAEQRALVESLAELTPPEAVIAASLNSGAIDLYAGRATVRPGRQLQPGYGWSDDDWQRVAAAILETGRPLYLLADSPELDAPLAALDGRYRVETVTVLYLPYFDVGGGAENRLVSLYRVVAD